MLANFFILATPPQQSGVPYPLLFFIMTAVILVGVLVLTIFLFRRMFSASELTKGSSKDSVPRVENVPAFMTASMQAVILRLREQEKELERLHRAERERAESTARLSEEVTRNMPAGLLVIGANGLISATNPAAEQALGIKTLTFRRYSEALGESSALSSLIQQCLAEGKIFRREQTAHIAPDGGHHELGVTISPIRRGQEKATGAICLLSDLTELAALQKQMQLRENLAALGELSAGIAHEFKNALATISGYAQMIQSDPSAADTPENASKILDQTRSITHVVAEFLRYARPSEISEDTVALGSLLDRIASEVRELQPQLQVGVEGDFREIAGDEGLLRQVFLNLARNAAEAAESHSPQPRVILRGEVLESSTESFQRIRILDNGTGIPGNVLPKLFHPFFTTKVNGTGLGLAVVQKILLQHGGQVEARNRVEGGAEFIVTLPAARRIPQAVESKEVTI
jgi:two-component system, NtrC family, sensor histidine kinase AtoS